jgi:type IV pilus assembly protein PilW
MRQKGFSLVEMMVSLVLGMIVIGAAMVVYIQTFIGNSSQIKMARLNGDLRIVMNQISRDLRRAGYHNWTLPQLGVGNYLVNPQPSPIMTTNSAAIGYDENANGSVDAADVFSYRWADANGDGVNDTIQARIGAGAWTNLTDPAVLHITNFAITDNSPAAINPTGAVAAVTIPLHTIEITGRLVSDTSVQRSVRETVRVRNPIFVANP